MEQHKCVFVAVTHPVRGLGGESENLVQRKCACGNVEPQPRSNENAPKIGEWI